MQPEPSDRGRLFRFPTDAHASVPPSHAGDEPTHHLVAAARGGDPQAWLAIGARYRSALLLLMRRRIPSAARRRFDSEDVFQSAMFCAYREIASYEYRGSGSFYGWLVRILQNRIRSKLREHQAEKRDARREQHLSSVTVDLPDRRDQEQPELLAARAEEYADLVQGFAQLEPEDQRLLALYMVDGLKLVELAAEFQLSPRTARRRLARAFEELQKKTGGKPPDPERSAFHPDAEKG